jgi:hypothetical protein
VFCFIAVELSIGQPSLTVFYVIEANISEPVMEGQEHSTRSRVHYLSCQSSFSPDAPACSVSSLNNGGKYSPSQEKSEDPNVVRNVFLSFNNTKYQNPSNAR